MVWRFPPTDSRVRQLADEQIPSFRSLSHVGVKDNRNATMDVAYFDKLRAIYFDDYLLVQGNFSSRTINGDISYIKSFFQVLVDREIITINPFQKLKKHKEASSRRNLALNKNQIKKIKKVIEKKDRQLWLFVQFIYYCYLRPNEVRQLTFQHIHLEKRQIFIPGHISKNGMDGYVTIPEVFARELKKKENVRTHQYIKQSGQRVKTDKYEFYKNIIISRQASRLKSLSCFFVYLQTNWD
ncbi:MAG: site-specific integrase [Bacteroidetes bacterium]|nr:site-specific integrase [Bacteroidota bacterium]